MAWGKPKKRFGQNFLVNDIIIDKIIEQFNPQKSQAILEIGPGRGALTHKLIQHAQHLYVVEIDREIVAQLKKQFVGCSTITLIAQDMLTFNLRALEQPVRVIGNLPYNISTEVLFHLLESKENIQDMLFMLQKEVVDRITASPNTKAYGKLSVLLQYACFTQKLFEVPPDAFYPKPKVTSSIVKLTPFKQLPCIAENTSHLKIIVHSAFTARRKTLRNALNKLFTEDDFKALALDNSLRPENLSVAQYVTLSNHFTQKSEQ